MKNRIDNIKAVSLANAKREPIEALTFYVTATAAKRIRRAAACRGQTLNWYGMTALVEGAYLYETEGIWENQQTGEVRFFQDYERPPGGKRALARDFTQEGFRRVKPGPDVSEAFPNDEDPACWPLGPGQSFFPHFTHLLRDLSNLKASCARLIPYLEKARTELKAITEGRIEGATIECELDERIAEEVTAMATLLGYTQEELGVALVMNLADREEKEVAA